MVIKYSIIIFITQLIFIGARTWNVRAIAEKNITQLMISGSIVHLAWLVSITLGVVSMKEIMLNFKLEYLPIIICSLTGGLIGSYIGLKAKMKK
tara:strand:- start:635 stop:916 length:282 start_codon:yes stop_codon:yes gene_type:complete